MYLQVLVDLPTDPTCRLAVSSIEVSPNRTQAVQTFMTQVVIPPIIQTDTLEMFSIKDLYMICTGHELDYLESINQDAFFVNVS